jgi:hypothetical protein
VVAYPDAFTTGGHTIAGQLIYGLAATDAGIFAATAAFPAPAWVRTGAQTGLDYVNCQRVVAGFARQLLAPPGDRHVTFVYVGAGSSLYLSASDGLYYDDLLAEPVDLEPFFQTTAAQSPSNTTALPFAPTSVVGLANTPASLPYIGTAGTVWQLPAAMTLPDAQYAWVSPLNERNIRSYRLTDFASAAPYFGMHAGEASDIEATSSTLPVVASTRLAQVMLRRVKEYSRPQITLTLRSTLNYVESKLRTLRPTQQVTVTIDRTAWGLVFAASPFYVLRHVLSVSRGDPVWRTETTLGSILRAQAPTDAQIAAALGYAASRTNRYARRRRT